MPSIPESPAPTTAHDPLRALLVRGLARGALAAAVVGGLAWSLGAAPAGAGPYLGLGVLVAIVAAAAALWLNGRFLATDAGGGATRLDGALLGARLQGLLAAALMVKLAVLGIAMFALHRAGVKFEALATFCVAFAAASLICQLTSAGYLSRALGSRTGGAARPSDQSPLSSTRSAANDVADV